MPDTSAPADLIDQAEQTYGLPPGLLGRVIGVGENSGQYAVSPKGAVGYGQLMPATAAAMGVTDPTDPAQNIDGSAHYLSQQLQAFGDPTLAVAAYNAGPGAVRRYGGVPPYAETQAYVNRVLPGPAQADDLPADADIDAAMKAGGGSEVPIMGTPGVLTPPPATGAPVAGAGPSAPAPMSAIVYDKANNVGRFPNGDIAYVGSPSPAPVQGPHGVEMTITNSSDPDTVSAWKAAHPDDPSNHILPADAEIDAAMKAQGASEDPTGASTPAAPAQPSAPAGGQPYSPYGLPPWLDRIYAGAKQFENGALAGLPNRFTAGVEAIPAAVGPLVHGDLGGAGNAYLRSFSDNFGRLQGIDNYEATRDPAARVGNLVNSVAGGVASMGVAPATQGAGMLGRAAIGATQAGAYGWLNGFMNSRGNLADMNRAGDREALVSMPLGAGLGAAFGPRAAVDVDAMVRAAPKLADFKATGIDPMLAVNGPISLQKVGQGLKGLPFVGTPLVAGAERTAHQGAQAAENIASRFGRATDAYQGGTALQRGANDAIAAMKATENGLYQRVNQLEANPTPVSATNTVSKVDDLFNAYPNLQDWFARQAPKLAQLRAGLAQSGGKATFAELKGVRSDVGHMLDDSLNVNKIDQGRLKQVYGALSDDLYAAARQIGGDEATAHLTPATAYQGVRLRRAGADEAEAALSRADTYASASRQRISDALHTILKANSSEDAYGKVLALAGSTQRADVAQLGQIKRTLDPKSFGDFTSAVLRKMGDDGNGGFSMPRFATAWSKLSPQGKSTMFGGMNTQLGDLESLATIARSQQAASKFYNHSNSGHQAGLEAGLIAVGDMVARAASGELPHALMDLGTMAGSALGGRTMASLLASPKTARLVLRATEARTAMQAQQVVGEMSRVAQEEPALASNIIDFRTEYLKRLRANAPVGAVSGAGGSISTAGQRPTFQSPPRLEARQ